MKSFLFIISAFFLVCNSTEPNAEEILERSIRFCQSIDNGYYEMDYYAIYPFQNDTAFFSNKCHFRKLENDSVFPATFHYESFANGYYVRDVLYTGEDLVTYATTTNTGEVTSTSAWASQINYHEYDFFYPLVDKKVYPFLQELKPDDQQSIEFIGEEKLNGLNCFHLKIEIIPARDTSNTSGLTVIKSEYHLWINQADYIPVQYSIDQELVFGETPIRQSQNFTLTNYELNQMNDFSLLSITAVPEGIQLTDYVPEEIPSTDILTKGTAAPDWTFASLKGDTISLAKLEGELVLIDFFFKNCPPCIASFPEIEELYQTYKNQGLRVVGIDPVDDKEKDDMENFISDQGITYPVLLSGNEIADAYEVPGYPTVFLIDQEGTILFSRTGFDKTVREELELIIKENL